MDSGLAITLVEAPLDLQQNLQIPSNHYDVCRAADVPTEGNAAGNTEDYLDLTGQNHSVAPLPSGFTAKGIVALVFSCLAAFLGMAVISWYGIQPVGAATQRAAETQIREADLGHAGLGTSPVLKTTG
jgi:iron transport multicopper oxidase